MFDLGIKFLILLSLIFLGVGLARYFKYINFNFDKWTFRLLMGGFISLITAFFLYRVVYPEVLYEPKEYRVVATFKETDGTVDTRKVTEDTYGVFKKGSKDYPIHKVLAAPDGKLKYKYVEFRKTVHPTRNFFTGGYLLENLEDQKTYMGILYVPVDKLQTYKQVIHPPKAETEDDEKDDISEWEKSKTYLPSSSSSSSSIGPEAPQTSSQ